MRGWQWISARYWVIAPAFQTWEDKQGALLHAVKVENAILNIILFFINLFGVYRYLIRKKKPAPA